MLETIRKQCKALAISLCRLPSTENMLSSLAHCSQSKIQWMGMNAGEKLALTRESRERDEKQRWDVKKLSKAIYIIHSSCLGFAATMQNQQKRTLSSLYTSVKRARLRRRWLACPVLDYSTAKGDEGIAIHEWNWWLLNESFNDRYLKIKEGKVSTHLVCHPKSSFYLFSHKRQEFPFGSGVKLEDLWTQAGKMLLLVLHDKILSRFYKLSSFGGVVRTICQVYRLKLVI